MSETPFPLPIRVTYDPSGGGFEQAEQQLKAFSANATRTLADDFNRVSGVITNALSVSRTAGGSLNIDAGQFARASENARALATASREVATSLGALRVASDQVDAALEREYQAALAVSAQHEKQARDAASLASVYQRLEGELQKTANATRLIAPSAAIAVEASNRQRQALVNLGFQAQDFAVQVAGGTSAFVAFAQQSGQAVGALQILSLSGGEATGRLATLARFLGSGWGVALSIALPILGSFAGRLFETADAAKTAQLATSSFGDAQSAVTAALTGTNSRLAEQNALLLANARLQAVNLRGEAAKNRAAFGSALSASGQGTFLSDLGGVFRNIGGAFTDPNNRSLGGGRAPSITPPSARRAQALLRGVQNGSISAASAIQQSEGIDLEGLQISRTEFQQAIIGIASAREQDAIATEIDRALDRGTPGRFAQGGRTRNRRGPSAETLANREFRATEFGDDTADKIAQITQQFDRTPPAIGRVNQALRQLDDLVNDIKEKAISAENEDLLAQLKQAEEVVANSLRAQFDQLIRLGQEDLEIQRLRTAGFEDQADALALQYQVMRELGVESVDQLGTALEANKIGTARYQQLQDDLARSKEITREQERRNRLGTSALAQRQQLGDFRSSLEGAASGLFRGDRSAISGLVSGLRNQVSDILGKNLIERVFGPAFADIEGALSTNPRVRADRFMAETTNTAAQMVAALGDAAARASERLNGTAANDNGTSANAGSANSATESVADILVTARRSADPLAALGKFLIRKLEDIFGQGSPLARALGNGSKGALEGAGFGLFASTLVFGKKSNALGASIGGAIGKGIGSIFGPVGGQIGSIVGGLIGSTVGRAISGAKTGTATIGGSGSKLTVGSFGGNKASFQKEAGKGGDAVIATIENIAEQLGATINAGAGSVTVGIRDGKYRVDPTGRGNTKTKKGAVDFGEDSAAAIRFATLDLIKDGVLGALRAGTLQLLKGAKDLEAGLQKALDFESVFQRLKAYKNPVGAALDTLDKEFKRLKGIFEEAGATTEEYAQLEELYGIERAKAVKEAAERVTASLKGLYDELTIGNDARSLSTRLSLAQAAYDPLKARVAAGDVTAYDDFANAAKALLDIQRQFSGSQDGYFSLLDQITSVSKGQIDIQQLLADSEINRASPFTATGDVSTLQAGNQRVIDALDRHAANTIDAFARISKGAADQISDAIARSGVANDDGRFKFRAGGY